MKKIIKDMRFEFEVDAVGNIIGLFKSNSVGFNIIPQPGNKTISTTKEGAQLYKQKKFTEYKLVKGKIEGTIGKERVKAKSKIQLLEEEHRSLEEQVATLIQTVSAQAQKITNLENKEIK